MYAKDNRGKGSRGVVKVGVDKGGLRLELPSALSKKVYGVRQKYITLGLRADNPEHRKLAAAKAGELQSDIYFERFDSTLKKYGLGKKKFANVVQFPTSSQPNQLSPTVQKLHGEYIETKRGQCAPGTWKSGHLTMRNHLEKCPFTSFNDAQKIFEWAVKTFTPDTAKRLITQLNAACHWGIKSQRIAVNPFEGMASEITVKKVTNEDRDINPFTKEERDLIIEAFANNRYYSRYASLVKFLFFTGCRPSEALALRWKSIQSGCILFSEAYVHGKGGSVLKEGLKTQKSRRFPINAEVLEILDEIKKFHGDPSPNALIFPSPEAKMIDFHNFRNRAWKSVLSGLDIEYRKPYQMRHTFITLAIDAGITIPKLAKLVGNSAKVILEHYAGTGSELTVPSLK